MRLKELQRWVAVAVLFVSSMLVAQDANNSTAAKSNKSIKRILWADSPVIIDLTKTTKPRKYYRNHSQGMNVAYGLNNDGNG